MLMCAWKRATCDLRHSSSRLLVLSNSSFLKNTHSFIGSFIFSGILTEHGHGLGALFANRGNSMETISEQMDGSLIP